MQSVLIINDSEHSTLKKSQRIIAKFLPQVGPTTYMGALSREGLADLERELTAIRSRYLSVACYQIAHNLSPSLNWIVGSKKNFDEEQSLYAHRRRTLKPELPYVEGTYTAKLLALTLRLAALTHDLGKMNDAFQTNLWSACSTGTRRRGEFIRHDAMSYRILAGLGWQYASFQALTTASAVQLGNLVAASSAAILRDTFNTQLSADLLRLARVMAPTKSRRGPEPTPLSVEELVCRLAAFLSISHHRLPGLGRHSHAKKVSYHESLSAETYFNPDQAPFFKECLTFSAGNVFQLDANLGSTLTKVLTELAELTALAPADFDANSFIRLILAHGRPILVFADHLASGLKSGEIVPAGALLGNTVRNIDESKPATPGDTLATHIRGVYQHTRRQAQFALSLIANKPEILPELSLAGQRSIAAKLSPVGKFAWQAELHAQLKLHDTRAPAFVVVTAGTGSGKTIASAQIMRALDSTRWTYCLGLRSLTLQTGQSYQKDLGLSSTDFSVVIGDDVAKKAFENENREACAAAGSESLTAEPEVTVVGGPQPDDWQIHIAGNRPRADLHNVFSARKLDFVAAPIVACTIDQLISFTRMATISHELDYKRMQSADLVLDEVDNYSPEELKHLAQLCYFAGLTRKNVVCLSATMGPLHVEALLAAYRAGIRLNHELTGLGADLRFVAAANVCPPESIVLSAGAPLQEALTLNERFNAATRAIGERLPPKARLGLLDCMATDHGAIVQEAIRLHRLNAAEIAGTQVSAGFIKMNTVGSARSLAKYLLEAHDLPTDVELAVVCYHAKFTGLEMALIERALNQVTNRKRLSPGSNFSEEAIKSYVGPLIAGAGKPNLIIIAVTTSIIETGRDHDYDWAILEPSSHRSIVQGSGRVRRHRDVQADQPQNVSLILYPARACGPEGYVPQNPVSVFSYPGPLTALLEKRFFDAEFSYAQLLNIAMEELGVMAPLSADMARDACARGFSDAYSTGVRNAIALTPPRELTNSLAVLEQFVLFKSLTEPAQSNSMGLPEASVSALAQLDKGLMLSSWAYEHSFRQSAASYFEDQVYIMQPPTLAAGRYIVTEPKTRLGRPAANVTEESFDIASSVRSLLLGAAGGTQPFTKLLADEARALAGAGFTPSDLVSFACYAPERFSVEPAKVFYGEHIGFNARAVLQ